MTNLLKQVYEEIYGPVEIGNKRQNLEELSQRMADIIGRPKPWSWRALNGVLNEQAGFNLTAEMEKALHAITLRMDGASTWQALIVPIRAYSINGNVENESIILGKSKRCENCQVLFVPRVPWQKYCKPDCRQAAYDTAAPD